MARKKRHSIETVLGVTVANADMEQESHAWYNTGAYVRLSKEDSGKLEGYSLQNQETLLRDYIRGHEELKLYKLYVDNGFTGTKFERPAFDEMMQDMKAGKINCIVVKDLSRLGRNYLEAGNYLEQIFPFFKVRFISITDGYDSISPDVTDESLIIPLKNIINEGYARDISTKVSSAIAIRKKSGRFMGKYPPYGYLKDPQDKGHLIPDPETSQNVQRIFKLRLEGMALGAIAKLLNEEKVAAPSRYWLEKGIAKERKFADSYWDRITVRRLLKNKVYLGMIVFGKEQTSFAKGIKRHTIPEEEWQTVEGIHEPLIDTETFEQVQNLLEDSKQRFREMTGINEDYKPVNLFRRLIRCADCGRSMKMSKFVRETKTGEKKCTAVYECSRHKKVYDYSCPQKSIHKDKLDQTVEEAIRYHIRMFLDTEKVIAELNKKPAAKSDAALWQEQVKKKQSRIARVEQMSCGIYEDYQDGILTEDEYLVMRKNYADEIVQLHEEVEQLIQQQTQYDEEYRARGSFSELVHKYSDFPELTREIIEAFISEVVVHTNGRLSIHFNFEDEFEQLMEIAERRKGVM